MMEQNDVVKMLEKLSDISERLAKVEVMLSERSRATSEIVETLEQHEDRIRNLEQADTQIFTTKNLFVWGIAVLIALWGVFH